MAEDSSRQGQADPLMMILPTILNAALTGKQPNVNDLLTVVLTGKPAATQGQATPAPQSTDPLALLVPILLQRVSGQPVSGGAAPAGDAKLPATVPAQTQADFPALKQVKGFLDAFKDLIRQSSPCGTAPNQDQMQKILDILKVVLGSAGKLGPVNGALGLTIGNVTLNVIGLPPGLLFTDSFGPNGFALSFASAAPQSAPEPAAGALLALGLAVLLRRSRFRSKYPHAVEKRRDRKGALHPRNAGPTAHASESPTGTSR